MTRLQGEAQILLGELDAMDLWHVARLPALPHVYQATLQGVGHGIPRVLKENGHLDKVLTDFLSGRPLDPAMYDGKALTIRGLSRTLWKALNAYNADRTNGTSVPQGAGAASGVGSRQGSAGVPLQSGGGLQTSSGVLQRTSAQARRDCDVSELLGQISRKLRDPLPALPALEQAMQRDPRNDRLHYELGMCHWVAGNKDQARAALRAAQELRPDDAHYALQLAKLGQAAS